MTTESASPLQKAEEGTKVQYVFVIAGMFILLMSFICLALYYTVTKCQPRLLIRGDYNEEKNTVKPKDVAEIGSSSNEKCNTGTIPTGCFFVWHLLFGTSILHI